MDEETLYSSRISALVLDIARTGSREICSVYSKLSDEDFILYVSEMNTTFIWKLLEDEGWKMGGSGESNSKFLSFKKKINDRVVNLIITSNKQYFDSFVHATIIAKQLDLCNKDDRVELFRIVRDSYERKIT